MTSAREARTAYAAGARQIRFGTIVRSNLYPDLKMLVLARVPGTIEGDLIRYWMMVLNNTDDPADWQEGDMVTVTPYDLGGLLYVDNVAD